MTATCWNPLCKVLAICTIIQSASAFDFWEGSRSFDDFEVRTDEERRLSEYGQVHQGISVRGCLFLEISDFRGMHQKLLNLTNQITRPLELTIRARAIWDSELSQFLGSLRLRVCSLRIDNAFNKNPRIVSLSKLPPRLESLVSAFLTFDDSFPVKALGKLTRLQILFCKFKGPLPNIPSLPGVEDMAFGGTIFESWFNWDETNVNTTAIKITLQGLESETGLSDRGWELEVAQSGDGKEIFEWIQTQKINKLKITADLATGLGESISELEFVEELVLKGCFDVVSMFKNSLAPPKLSKIKIQNCKFGQPLTKHPGDSPQAMLEFEECHFDGELPPPPNSIPRIAYFFSWFNWVDAAGKDVGYNISMYYPQESWSAFDIYEKHGETLGGIFDIIKETDKVELSFFQTSTPEGLGRSLAKLDSIFSLAFRSTKDETKKSMGPLPLLPRFLEKLTIEDTTFEGDFPPTLPETMVELTVKDNELMSRALPKGWCRSPNLTELYIEGHTPPLCLLTLPKLEKVDVCPRVDGRAYRKLKRTMCELPQDEVRHCGSLFLGCSELDG